MTEGSPPPIEDLLAGNGGRALEGRPFARRALHDLSAVDHAVYQAIASTSTPAIDVPLRLLSDAANRSVIWVATAGVLACFGGLAVAGRPLPAWRPWAASSAVVNVGLKQLAERARPDREQAGAIRDRHTRCPTPRPSHPGHSASGFAFATPLAGRSPRWLSPSGSWRLRSHTRASTRESTTPGTSS